MPFKHVVYDSAEHRVLLDAILSRQRLSEEKMRQYHNKWTKAEEQFIAYIPETDEDAVRRELREKGRPQFTTLEIPYTYATVMTAITYWTTVFLARNPIHQYTARHGEPEMQVQAVEALMDYQVNVGRMLVPYYIWITDAAKYGLGILGTFWDEETAIVSEIIEVPETYLDVPLIGRTKKQRKTSSIPGYKGNKGFNIRPYDWFPDPRVPLLDFQKGEFCGRRVDVGWNTIVRGEAEGKYFNIDVLKRLKKPGSAARGDEGSSQLIVPDTSAPIPGADHEMKDLGYVELLEMVVELSPKAWGFGSSTYPEKWVFTIANDSVIIGLEPLGAYHDKFPFDILETEIDGYSLIPRSLSETIEPLNHALTFLFNSHFFNVRKVLNDQMVVDPSRVVMKDVTDPNAGRIIRLKQGAYGTDARAAIHQLDTVDVTQNHMRDAQIVIEMIQRISGVSDNTMGVVNPGGRKTATEIRTSSSFSVNRLKLHAEYMSAVGWASHSQKLLQNTQQNYDGMHKFKIVGDLVEPGVLYREIAPEDIMGFFDFTPVDGTMPIDRFAMANLWRELMAQMAKMPGLAAEYSLGRVFEYTAKLAGAKNIQQFRVQVRPDEEMQRNAQAGNIVPIGGQNDRGGNVRSEESAGRVPEPGQVGGVGPTG